MIYRIIQPSIHLQPFVKSYTLLDFVIDRGAPLPVKPFPAHTDHSLVLYLRGKLTAVQVSTGEAQQFTRIAINGVQTSRLNFHLPLEYRMLAVNFQPGVLSRFLRVPIPEFTDKRIDAETLLNPGIAELYERLVDTGEHTALLPQLEAYLWRRIGQLKIEWHPLDRVGRLMIKPNIFNIKQLADMACLSISQFERRFLQQNGVTPKYYARISRFGYACSLKEAQPELSWLGVGLAAGYHDYQHMAKDFKTFAGQLPEALLVAQSHAPERILDPYPLQ